MRGCSCGDESKSVYCLSPLWDSSMYRRHGEGLLRHVHFFSDTESVLHLDGKSSH